MSSYVNCLGGRCPHMPFFIGGHMSGGENVLHSTHLSVVSKLIVIVSSKVLDVFLRPDMNEKFLTGTLSHSTITTRGCDKFHTPTLPSRVRLSTTEPLTTKLYSDSVFAFSASKLYLNFSFGVLIPHHHLCSACANPEGTGVWTPPPEK